MSRFDEVIESMKMLVEDTTTPRSVRDKLNNMVGYLQGDEDDQRKISTVQSELEDMSADVNIEPYVRTQLYSISSQLEAIGSETRSG